MQTEIKKLQKMVKRKELKVEKTSFKLTKLQKQKLTEIRDTYGKSYGFIVTLIVDRLYRAMLDDDYTNLLNDAKKLDKVTEESLSILKHHNPEGHKIAQGVWKGLGEVCQNIISVNTEVKEKLIKFQTEIGKLEIHDKERLSIKERNKVLSIVQKFIDDQLESIKSSESELALTLRI